MLLLLLVMALLPVTLSFKLEDSIRWTVPDVNPAAYIEVTGPSTGSQLLLKGFQTRVGKKAGARILKGLLGHRGEHHTALSAPKVPWHTLD